jgi:integrase
MPRNTRTTRYWGIKPRGKKGLLWLWFTAPDGRRIRQPTGTADWDEAAELRDRLKADLWRQAKLGERPVYTWEQAVIRWLTEQQGRKKTLEDDKMHLRFTAGYLDGLRLVEIDRETLARVAQARQATGVANATVNRMLEVIHAILVRAHKEWGWLDQVPAVRRLAQPKRRVRWLTREEAARLLAELPEHLAEMARFSLATGLRESNVTGLRWEQIDLSRRTAWIHQDQMKGEVRALAVPLNDDAVAVLRRQVGKHREYVFTYRGQRVTRANNHAWRKALTRAGIHAFRWHDLRHTWASWHVQAGTPLHVLQELGGWSSYELVMRYAHLGGQHLQEHANAVSSLDTNWAQMKRAPQKGALSG